MGILGRNVLSLTKKPQTIIIVNIKTKMTIRKNMTI
jgi:hypothetical protein